MAALNNRFRPRFGISRLRGFSLMFGMSHALKIALRLYLESKPPSRLRYEPPIFKSAHGICFIGWCDRKRRQHEAVVVDSREDLFALLMFVAGKANAIAAFLRHRVGAIAMQDIEIEVAVRRQMPHAGDERLIK